MLKFNYVDLRITIRENYLFIDVFTRGLKKEIGFIITKKDVLMLSNNLTINDISSIVIFENRMALNTFMFLKIQSVKKIDVLPQVIYCGGRVAINE